MSSETLPPNWSWVKLGDVGEIISGGTPSTKIPEYFDGDIAWITPADLTGYKNKYISRGRRNISEEGLKNSSARIIPQGSILFSSRAPIGYVAIASNDISTNQGFKNLVISNKVNSEFVFYYLKSAKQLAEKNASGTTFKEISSTNFAKLPFPLPTLPEQKNIVEKIEELFSGLDSGVASLKKAKAQIRLYRQSVLASAFSGKLLTPSSERIAQSEILKAAEPKVEYSNQLPEGWKWVKLGDVTNNFDGKRIPLSKEVRSKRKGEYRYYGATEIIDLIDEYIFDGTYLLIGEDGANLVSKSRPLSFIVEGKFWVNNHAHVLQTKDELKIKYLDYYFNSITLEPYVTGSAQPKLNQMNLNKIPVPLAPLNQQTQIVEEIEKRFSEADNLEKAIDESLAKSETLRQSILKQAFEGKLV